jgi:hypothetical protein
MHTTSDFPTLLTSASGRVLLDTFQAAGSALRAISAKRDAADFRPITSVRLGEAPALQKVNEGGEVKYGSRAEAKESFRVETFARIFSLSRQAIINDDLQAFADISAAYGRAAAECEASGLASLIAANSGLGPEMDDGNTLYSAAHANYTTPGGQIDVTSLDIGRKALRSMKGLDGKTPIGVTPKFLVVGPEQETAGEQILASLAAAEVGEVNPFSGKLTLLVEPRFTGNAWRLFADPGELPVIRRAYLNGNDGPIVEQRDGWTTLGVEFRAILDFGCGIEEYRGTYMNAGA